MVELRGISKYFPSNGVTALKNACFTLCSGEIHALLGENGTGKSTLMHIFSGYFPPSSGSILIDGKEKRFSSPAYALAVGIGMVRQHPGFVKGFKVWEDCILGAEKQGRKFFNPSVSKKRVEELSAKWNFDLPLDRQTESLTISQRQKAAVLSLLLRDIKWFIFDEPTAVLSLEESGNMLDLFRRLRGDGKGVVLITHKLEEALDVSNRVTIMQRGVTGESRNTLELSLEDLKDAVFGGKIGLQRTVAGQLLSACGEKDEKGILPKPKASQLSKPILEIKNLQLEPAYLPHIRNVNLSLLPGKVVGIAGVREGGLETLELALTGMLRRTGKFSGSIILNGHDITGRAVRSFREAGGAYLGADRLGGNLAPELPLSESLIIHAFRRERRWIFLDSFALKLWRRKIMSRAGISRPVSDRADSFSGGMIQRILLAREFAEDPLLLVLAEAGSSLDHVNSGKLAEELKALVLKGHSALLFSTDMEKLVLFTDEILLLRNGTLTNFGENNEI